MMSEFNLEELPDVIKLLEDERDYFDYPSPTCEIAINAINALQAKVEELTAALNSIISETDEWICCHDVNQIAKAALKEGK